MSYSRSNYHYGARSWIVLPVAKYPKHQGLLWNRRHITHLCKILLIIIISDLQNPLSWPYFCQCHFSTTGVRWCLKILREQTTFIYWCWLCRIFACVGQDSFNTKNDVHSVQPEHYTRKLVPDTIASSFICSSKRFLLRYGFPVQIVCDHAKTFKAAAKTISIILETTEDQ
jgi:hypothetical protein